MNVVVVFYMHMAVLLWWVARNDDGPQTVRPPCVYAPILENFAPSPIKKWHLFLYSLESGLAVGLSLTTRAWQK